MNSEIVRCCTGVPSGTWSWVDDADGGGSRTLSGRRQGEARGCSLAGDKTLVVKFRNGQDDRGRRARLSLCCPRPQLPDWYNMHRNLLSDPGLDPAGARGK